MNNISEAFNDKKAFIPFITAGYPDLETTEQILPAMQEAGADLIEIGIPFSDPAAEGPVIQQADEMALKAGTQTNKIFDMIQSLKPIMSIPMVFMTYANPIYVYGIEKFAKKTKECGISGIIIPDVPFEESKEFKEIFKKYDITVISMIAPTSLERVKMIAKEAEGFVYCVSSLGVTGMRSEISSDIARLIQEVKKVKEIPCAVGFGISTPEQAEKIAEFSDGAIVGSAIVKLAGKYKKGCVPYIYDYIKQMKNAVLTAK